MSSITKSKIIQSIMEKCNLGYIDATRVHDCFIEIFQDAIVNVQPIRIGHIGVLRPKISKSKPVSMNFTRDKDGIKSTQRYFYLDERVKFHLHLYRTFQKTAEFHKS